MTTRQKSTHQIISIRIIQCGFLSKKYSQTLQHSKEALSNIKHKNSHYYYCLLSFYITHSLLKLPFQRKYLKYHHHELHQHINSMFSQQLNLQVKLYQKKTHFSHLQSSTSSILRMLKKLNTKDNFKQYNNLLIGNLSKKTDIENKQAQNSIQSHRQLNYIYLLNQILIGRNIGSISEKANSLLKQYQKAQPQLVYRGLILLALLLTRKQNFMQAQGLLQFCQSNLGNSSTLQQLNFIKLIQCSIYATKEQRMSQAKILFQQIIAQFNPSILLAEILLSSNQDYQFNQD